MDKKASLNAGHRERLRASFFKCKEALPDYMLLELLLTFAIPRRDVKPIAKTLLLNFGSLSGVLNADKETLCRVNGIGESAAALIKTIKEISARSLLEECREKDLLNQPELVADFVRMKIGGEPRETLLVIYLDTNARVLDYDINSGNINRAMIYADELAKSVLLRNAASVILAHNHPSGICMPSENDVALTKAIASALNTVGRKLLDHLIVSPHTYYSLRQYCHAKPTA